MHKDFLLLSIVFAMLGGSWENDIFLGSVSWHSWAASVIFFIFGSNIAHSEHRKHHKTDLPVSQQCISYGQWLVGWMGTHKELRSMAQCSSGNQ